MKKILCILISVISIFSMSYAATNNTINLDYENAINNLTDLNILSGYPDGTFKGENTITRSEVAKIIALTIAYSNNEEIKDETMSKDFSDLTNNHWAYKYITYCIKNNIIEGYPDGTFNPESEITYGEFATMITKAFGMQEDAKKSELSWPDNYMDCLEKSGFANKVATNDFIAINKARRDNVVLIVSEFIQKNKDDDTEIIDTKTMYFGVVKVKTIRAGITYFDIENLDGKKYTLEASNITNDTPELGSFIMYKLASNGKMKLQKELKIEQIDDERFLYVEKIEDGLIIIRGEEILDFDVDEYNYNGETIALKKYKYIIAENDESNGKNILTLFDEQTYENVQIKKYDRIVFDKDTKVCLIIRGLDEK